MSVHLLRGKDEVLLAQALAQLLGELVGDQDRALVVEDIDGDDYDISIVVEAAQTPPFLTDRRVVVARGFERFTTAAAVAPLVTYLADPLPTTDLVLVALGGGGGRIPASLTTAMKGIGAVVTDTDAPAGKARQGWLDGQFKAAPVQLDAAARNAVTTQLGEEVGRLDALFDTLTSTFGPGARVTLADVEPFLGEAGGVPPWELTDAIDEGDAALAIARLGRMMDGGERHPLAIMAILHGHYARILRLDGSEAVDERSAAEVLGIKGSTFPARKALTQLRKLGSRSAARAIVLLAEADLDLRGRRDVPERLVMEVLVARLAALAPRHRRTTAARARG